MTKVVPKNLKELKQFWSFQYFFLSIQSIIIAIQAFYCLIIKYGST